MPLQRFQSPDSRKSGPPSISFATFTPNLRSTSRLIYIYGMLFGSLTATVVFFDANGRAVSRPEMS